MKINVRDIVPGDIILGTYSILIEKILFLELMVVVAVYDEFLSITILKTNNEPLFNWLNTQFVEVMRC